MKLSEIAEAIDARIEGDGDLEITRVVHPAEAEGPGDLALATDKALIPLLADSKAGAVMVTVGTDVPARITGRIVVVRPRYAMAGVSDLFERPAHRTPGVHPMSAIDPTAKIGRDVSIGPFVSIGPNTVIGDGVALLSNVSIGADANIGDGTLVHAGARIGDRVVMGKRCVIQPNAAIGNDGFSFVTPEPGSVESAKATGEIKGTNAVIRRVNSLGTVILGDDVEVGAGSTIDRGTITATRVGSGTKIDNLVQIGHNVEIGTNCMLCGLVGIAGSCVIGDRVVLAGQVGVADHVSIGHDSVVAARSGVAQDLAPQGVYFGAPAVPRKEAFEQLRNLGRLSRLLADVREIKEKLK